MTQLLTITQDNRDIFHSSHNAVADLVKILGLSSFDNSAVYKIVLEIKNEGVFVTVSSFMRDIKNGTSEQLFILKDGNNDPIKIVYDILGLSLLRGICYVKLTVEAGCLASLNLEIEPGVCSDYIDSQHSIRAIPIEIRETPM